MGKFKVVLRDGKAISVSASTIRFDRDSRILEFYGSSGNQVAGFTDFIYWEKQADDGQGVTTGNLSPDGRSPNSVTDQFEVILQASNQAAEDYHSGDRLRMIAMHRDITFKSMSVDLGVSPQTLDNWFKRGIPAREIQAVSDFYSFPRSWLENGRIEGVAHDR